MRCLPAQFSQVCLIVNYLPCHFLFVLMYELSADPAPIYPNNYELSAQSVIFKKTGHGTHYVASCVLVFLRSQSLPMVFHSSCHKYHNPVHGISTVCHQRLFFCYIDSHTTQTVAYKSGLQFPSSIALITHTHSCIQSETLYKPWTSSFISPSIVQLLSL